MKSLLFALGLALCCAVESDWKEMGTTDQMTQNMGDWMCVAVACNSPEMQEQLKNMPVFLAELSRPREDVFSILVFLPMSDGCKNVTYQFRRGEDGKYHGHSGDTALTVESVKSHGEFVMTVINVGNEFRTASLHSRKGTQNPEILQKFEEECKQLGFHKEDIEVLSLPVKCQKE